MINHYQWTTAPLSELIDSIDSGKSPCCLDRPIADGEWGVLKLSAATWCQYDPLQNKAIPTTETPDPALEVKKGDVLFTRKNTYDLVAAAAYVYDTPPNLMLPDLIFRFRFSRNSRICPEYLWGLLTWPSKRRQVQTLAGGAAGSMPNISKAKLLTLDIEVPPIQLQHKYRDQLHQIRNLEMQLQQAEIIAFKQFESLSQRAFCGEL